MSGYGRSDARRIGAAVKVTERRPRNRPQQRARWPIPIGAAVRLAVVASAISARSGSTAGSGQVTFLEDNTTLTAGPVTVNVSNWTQASVASGYVVVFLSGSIWWLLSGDCP